MNRPRLLLAFSLLLWCTAASAEGELLLPILGPILHASKTAFGTPLCAAPKPFDPEYQLTPPNTFDQLVEKLFDNPASATPTDTQNAALVTDEYLLKSTIHLARLRGLHEVFANRDAWHVVSLRADYCDPNFHDEAGPHREPCRDEFRIVAQPFLAQGLYVIAHDYAMHLIYDLADRERFAGMRTKLDEMASGISLNASAQALLHSDRFSCSLDINKRIRQLIAEFATPGRLRAIAWMTSSTSGQQWSFGRFLVSNNGILNPQRVSGLGYFDNFSKPMMLSERCSINIDASPIEKSIFRCNKTAPDESKKRAEFTARLSDPLEFRRSANLCVACHTLPALIAIQKQGRINDDLGLPIFKSQHIELSDLRQFGYDLHGYRSISERVRKLAAGSIP